MLSEIPMFKNFSEEEKKQFVKMNLSLHRFQEGDIIFKEGELYSSLYLIVKGTVSIKKSGFEVPIAHVTSGNVFGEMSFLTKKPRHSDVIAADDVLVIRMDDSFFEEIGPVMQNKIKDFLMELLISRLDKMNEAISKIAKFAAGRTLE